MSSSSTKVKVNVAQLCPSHPLDYTVCGILQARILEWVAFSFSKGSSQPRDGTHVSCFSYIESEYFMAEPTGKPHNVVLKSESLSVVSNSLQPHGLYSPWNSPGQNTGVGSLFVLPGIFPTQGSNLGLSNCRQILYQLSHNCSIKRNKVLIHAPTWINFKNMLSQRSQT